MRDLTLFMTLFTLPYVKFRGFRGYNFGFQDESPFEIQAAGGEPN